MQTSPAGASPLGSNRGTAGAPATPGEDASLGELFGRLGQDLSLLVRQEVELAKAEITQEVTKAGKGAGFLGGSGITGLFALLLLSFAAAWGLAAAIPTGVAFLIIGLLYAAAAGFLFLRGRSELRRVHPVPEQTVATVKEDVQWAKHPKS
jgi:hypothetical protein